MLIAGLQKTSFVDYPGEPAAVIFTPYCNYACGYCHNAHILGHEAPLIDEGVVLPVDLARPHGPRHRRANAAR